MKITDVTATILAPPEFPHGGPVLVRVRTDSGIEGIGEAGTFSQYGEESQAVKIITEHCLRKVVHGENPADFRSIWDKMYAATFYNARCRDVSVNAISGVDMAIIDLLGKIEGKPVYRILGGKFREKVRAYCSTIFNRSKPELTINEIRSYQDQGFSAVKLGLTFGYGGFGSAAFGLDIKNDVDFVKTVKDAVGDDMDLMIDGPRTLDYPTAVRIAKELEKLNVFWYEEPISAEDLNGYAKLAADVTIPIAMGESERTRYGFMELIEKNTADILQPDVSWVGGITEAKRIADMAEDSNYALVPHNWGTVLNTAASVHLVASMKNGFLCEYPNGPRTIEAQEKHELPPMLMELAVEPIRTRKGFIEVSESPGLGIELNEKKIEQYTLK
jgi:L-alanine-DL-glutamate epimerase-like enolase superfamily enzyme